MTLFELAHKLRSYIEKAAISLTDEEALEASNLFPNWTSTKEDGYKINDRVRYENILYKCLQNHIPQEIWTPVATPSLWTKVLIPDENIIPEWEQPDSTNPYQIGDKVRHNGKIWENTINNNVWEPGIYGWAQVQEE